MLFIYNIFTIILEWGTTFCQILSSIKDEWDEERKSSSVAPQFLHLNVIFLKCLLQVWQYSLWNFVSYVRWRFDVICRVAHSWHFNLETAAFLHFCILLDVGLVGVRQNPDAAFFRARWLCCSCSCQSNRGISFRCGSHSSPLWLLNCCSQQRLTDREQRHGHLLKCHRSIVCIVIQRDAAGHENNDECTLLLRPGACLCAVVRLSLPCARSECRADTNAGLCERAPTFRRHVQHQRGHTDSAQTQSFAFGFLREGAGQVSGVTVLVRKSIVRSPSLNQHSAPRSAHLETVMRLLHRSYSSSSSIHRDSTRVGSNLRTRRTHINTKNKEHAAPS